MNFALSGATIFDGFELWHDHALLVSDDKVVGMVSPSDIPSHFSVQHTKGGILTPGFIDLQVNGGGGVLLNNKPTAESLDIMVKAHEQFGVTRILPTLISDDVQVTLTMIDVASTVVTPHSAVLGLHIEGPFFSLEKAGVHQPVFIRTPSASDVQWMEKLASMPAIVTLAPEQVTLEVIEQLNRLNIRVCAGHTNATYEQVTMAINHGLSGFTHLFNAMRHMSGREPGVVGAALDSKNTWAGIIADGIHVHPASIRNAIKAKGFEHIFLVSDSMATVGAEEKSFLLYGETISEQNGQLVNSEGRLAGSAISMLDAVQLCVKQFELPLTDVLAMASRVPAEYLGVNDRLGQFRNGYLADICHLDESLNLQQVWRNGIALH